MASIYTFNSYLNCLPMTMDGTYKLYPSKYIALSDGSYEEIVNLCNNYENTTVEQWKVLPFSIKDNAFNVVDDKITSIVDDPNDNDGTYKNQTLGDLGTLVCGGDINFLNHDDSTFETIVYVSQSDMQAYTYVTSFSEDSLPLEDTIFVDTTGITKDVSTTKFDAIVVFFNVYRKVGESIDEDNDIYLRDMPALILDVGDTIELDSEKEWLTRIVMSLSNDGTIEIKSITDDEVKDIDEALQLLKESKDELDEEASKDYTDLDEVRSYYDYFKDNRQTNVPYIQGDWWFVNGKKAGLYQIGVDTESLKTEIAGIKEEQSTLEEWVGYDKDVGGFKSLYDWILNLANNVLTNTSIDEKLANYETIEAHDEDITNLKTSIEDDLKKYVDDYINNDVLKLTVDSDSTSWLEISGDYQISFKSNRILEEIDEYLLANIGNYISSDYVTQGDFKDKISDIETNIETNYQKTIGVATHSSWQRLTLTEVSNKDYQYQLDFNNGHMGQTVIDDANDKNYVNNQWYTQISYGDSPYADEEVIQDYPNSIQSQIFAGCTDSLFSSYTTSKFLDSTDYHKEKGSLARIMCRDNTYKNYIPRAYMQVTPDVIDFVIDSHEETSDDNTHPSITSHDTYSIHICFTKNGIYIGENLLSSVSSEGNMYINNSPILTLDNLEKLTGLSPS